MYHKDIFAGNLQRKSRHTLIRFPYKYVHLQMHIVLLGHFTSCYHEALTVCVHHLDVQNQFLYVWVCRCFLSRNFDVRAAILDFNNIQMTVSYLRKSQVYACIYRWYLQLMLKYGGSDLCTGCLMFCEELINLNRISLRRKVP